MTRLGLPLLLLAAGLSHAENWPQWRGPNNDGISNEKNLPAEWSDTKNVAWKLEMPGQGGSTPVVWGDRIFLTSQDGSRVVAMCVSTSGKELWKKDLGSAAVPKTFGAEGNGASATPSTDGKHVYCFGGDGTFAAFDLDGKEAWRFNAQERYGKFNIQFGIHSTPVLHGDRLYFQLIHSGTRRRDGEGSITGLVICLDKATGKEVWKVDRASDGTDENEHSYASAVLWQNGKDAYLVCHGNDYTTAHSLQDGKEIWRLMGLNPRAARYHRTLRFVASPACSPGLIVVPTAKREQLVAVRPDATGEVRPGGKGEAWRIPKELTPDVPSPLIHDGLVYVHGQDNAGGLLACLDAATGAVVYRGAIHKSRHRASAVLADNKIYLVARDGTTTVVQPGREFKKLATNKLPDQIAASPAVSGGRIYLRGFKYLWAVEEKK